MPQVDVSINGRRYQIACDEGQEEHLSQLAEYVDQRVQELVGAVGVSDLSPRLTDPQIEEHPLAQIILGGRALPGEGELRL